jgi:hypothetical protein
LFLITLGASLLVLITLIVLLTIFVIRRKAYLRQKLIENVSNMKKPKFDDVERLIHSDKANFMNKVWPFKTKPVNVQQAVSNPLDYSVFKCCYFLEWF